MNEQERELCERGRRLNFFFPAGLLTPGTIFQHARRPETRRRLIDALRKAQLDDLDHWRIDVLALGLARFGEAWDYLDNICVAHAFAELAGPKNVLEIGVRRGMSTVAIAAGTPDANLTCIDLWIQGYGERPNPGESAIRPDLLAVGHRGNVVFHTGNSHQVLPQLFAQQPGVEFDLILVDGDHTEAGALQDLRDVFPHLGPGGMLVFDDVGHPMHPELFGLWQRCMNELGMNVRHATYRDHGHGVAIALRSTF
jgi:predicted O-methyltransferase YrrM